MNKKLRHLVLVLLPFALAGCEQSKSSSPLSPLLAGPMVGVNMSAPKGIQPANGQAINDKDQPVTLLLQNPDTNSPRPVSMRLQIAADAAFTNLAYTKDGLAPTANSTLTFYKLPSKLAAGKTYYWRAAAGDGANDSGWGSPTRFDILQPVVLGIPDPKSPIGNERVTTITPQFTAANGQSSGPTGPLYYNFQIATSSTFSTLFTNAMIEEGSGQTQYTMPPVPSYDSTLFWRVRILATDSNGDWSRIESFRTPTAPPAAPKPGPGGGTVPTGNWQSCSSLVSDKPALSQCVHDAIAPGGSLALAFEITKRIAWLLKGEGGGLLIKNGGENIISWQGYSFSVSRMCFPDGHIYKVISDAGEGGTNGTSWSDNGFVDTNLYVKAIDPTLPSPVAALWPAQGIGWTRPPALLAPRRTASAIPTR